MNLATPYKDFNFAILVACFFGNILCNFTTQTICLLSFMETNKSSGDGFRVFFCLFPCLTRFSQHKCKPCAWGLSFKG